MSRWWNIEHVSKSARRSVVLKEVAREVAQGGESFHSHMGLTLPAIIEALEEHGVPYEIHAQPGLGYTIKGKPGR